MSYNGPLPQAIVAGGTDASSYAQTNGIVAYNGTKLINYASGPEISSSGFYTNSSQPAFYVYVNTQVNNVTGDNTVYTVIYDTKVYDTQTNFNLTTGTFTAPVTGLYMLGCGGRLQSGTEINGAVMTITASSGLNSQATMPSGPNSITVVAGYMTVLYQLSTNDTVTVTISSNDTGGKIDDLSGVPGSGAAQNFFWGMLVS